VSLQLPSFPRVFPPKVKGLNATESTFNTKIRTFCRVDKFYLEKSANWRKLDDVTRNERDNRHRKSFIDCKKLTCLCKWVRPQLKKCCEVTQINVLTHNKNVLGSILAIIQHVLYNPQSFPLFFVE
jgi:hypothetical protein